MVLFHQKELNIKTVYIPSAIFLTCQNMEANNICSVTPKPSRQYEFMLAIFIQGL